MHSKHYMTKRIFSFLSIFAAVLLLSSTTAISNDNSHDYISNNLLTVHFLNMGQADSTLIQLPNNETMLIDVAYKKDVEFITDYMDALNIDSIDYLIGTHPHDDHIGGLYDIAKEVDIKALYVPTVDNKPKTYERFLAAIMNNGVNISNATPGALLVDRDELKVQIVAPLSSEYKNLNEYSVVIRVVYKDMSYLFPADAETVSENEILKSKTDISAKVLKVGHHGDGMSSSPSYLEAVNPEYAIISCGEDNQYNHPDPIVIDRLLSQNASIFRTDLQGTIVAYSDGSNISFNKHPLDPKLLKKAPSPTASPSPTHDPEHLPSGYKKEKIKAYTQ